MLFVYVYFTDGLEKWARCFSSRFGLSMAPRLLIVAETRDYRQRRRCV